MVITLLTDFGLADPYVGVMKGVIFGLAPEVKIVDICHGIPPQDVNAAGFVLQRSYRYFSQESVHCVVVDPGVGSQRAILIAKTGKTCFVAPDNGVLTRILDEDIDYRLYHATKTEFFLKPTSGTFHGRDVFAPVAAYLALGIKPETIGEPAETFVRGDVLSPAAGQGRITGHIVYFDRFGNAVTNIHRSMIANIPSFRILIDKIVIPNLSHHYSAVKQGELAALIGSFDTLEIARREGNAKVYLNLKSGQEVIIEKKD
jgi:S-adenosylmethionine hydrolase